MRARSQPGRPRSAGWAACAMVGALVLAACGSVEPPAGGAGRDRVEQAAAQSSDARTPDPDVTPASLRLAQVYENDALTITPIRAFPGWSAVQIVEYMTAADDVWGQQLQIASRKLAAAFAGDPTFGSYLAIVFDPEVEGERRVDLVLAHGQLQAPGADPFPPLLFVWSRPDVERYASCGIPPAGVYDECSDDFTWAARVHELRDPPHSLTESGLPVTG